MRRFPVFFLTRAAAFTLVELLVVIAILSVLAAVALPAYNNYSLKSKFSEVVLATSPTKTAIAACAGTGDCVSGGAISLSGLSSGGTVPGLYYPSYAGNPAGSPNAYAVMLALQQAGSDYNNRNDSLATSQTYTNNDLAAGDYVEVDPSNPANLCIVLWNQANGSCYPGSQTPFALFNKHYAPNAALLAAASTMSLPCVGASGCSPATKYVASVSYDASGVITGTAVASSGLKGETFVLTPAYSGGRVDWSASGSCKTRGGGSLC